MKMITLVTIILLTASSYTYAGHSKNDDLEQDKDTNEVTISKGNLSENVEQVTTGKNNAATPGGGIDLIDQYYDVYETYRDLDINLGS